MSGAADGSILLWREQQGQPSAQSLMCAVSKRGELHHLVLGSVSESGFQVELGAPALGERVGGCCKLSTC